jgi:hypothetical protein
VAASWVSEWTSSSTLTGQVGDAFEVFGVPTATEDDLDAGGFPQAVHCVLAPPFPPCPMDWSTIMVEMPDPPPSDIKVGSFGSGAMLAHSSRTTDRGGSHRPSGQCAARSRARSVTSSTSAATRGASVSWIDADPMIPSVFLPFQERGWLEPLRWQAVERGPQLWVGEAVERPHHPGPDRASLFRVGFGLFGEFAGPLVLAVLLEQGDRLGVGWRACPADHPRDRQLGSGRGEEVGPDDRLGHVGPEVAVLGVAVIDAGADQRAGAFHCHALDVASTRWGPSGTR